MSREQLFLLTAEILLELTDGKIFDEPDALMSKEALDQRFRALYLKHNSNNLIMGLMKRGNFN